MLIRIFLLVVLILFFQRLIRHFLFIFFFLFMLFILKSLKLLLISFVKSFELLNLLHSLLEFLLLLNDSSPLLFERFILLDHSLALLIEFLCLRGQTAVLFLNKTLVTLYFWICSSIICFSLCSLSLSCISLIFSSRSRSIIRFCYSSRCFSRMRR